MRRRYVACGLGFLLSASLFVSCATPRTPIQGGHLVVFVNPGGSGPGSGTQASPYTSLTAARTALRPFLATMKSDAYVELESGTYALPAPFALTPADSGHNGYKVLYEAAPGSHPVVSGGVAIRGWRPWDSSRDIWAASVPVDFHTRQLYVNGTRAAVAHGPVPVSFTLTKGGYQASSPEMATWRNPTGIEFIYPSGPSNWTESRCRVHSIEGTSIVMDQPCWDNTARRDTPGTTLQQSGFGQSQNLGGPFTVSNAYELLSAPGQWYLDPERHMVFYIPLPGQDMRTAAVIAPRLQTLVEGYGAPASPVHDIGFVGITFSYATWLGPDTPDGYSDFQTGTYLSGPGAYRVNAPCTSPGSPCFYSMLHQVPGNVAFHNDRRIVFRSDTFEHLGGTGLQLGDATQDATVTGNVFTDISGGGLIVGGIDQPAAAGPMRTSGVVVSDNWFHNTSDEYQDCAAAYVGYGQVITFAHNQINDVPYSGIAIGWGGWRERLPGLTPLPNYSRDNVISGNLVFDEMKVLVDGGGIYTLGIEGTSMSDAETIEGNVVLEQHHPSWAIYTDNGTEFVRVEGNVVFDALTVPLAPLALPGLSATFSFGGCGGGPIAYGGNYSIQEDPAAGLISANPACGGHPLVGVTVLDNNVIGSLGDVRAGVVASAGLEPQSKAVLSPTPMPNSLPATTTFP